MNIIELPIGDWSDDGHDQCDYFNMVTNQNVETVRDVHFSCAGILGFDIGDINNEFDDPDFPEEIKAKIAKVNISVVGLDSRETYTPERLAKLWVDILQYLDPNGLYSLQDQRDKVQSIAFFVG